MGLFDKGNMLQSEKAKEPSLRTKAISIIQNEAKSAAKPLPRKSSLPVVNSAPLALSATQPEIGPPPLKAAPVAKSPAGAKPAPETRDAGKHPSAVPVVPPPVKTAPTAKSPAEVKPAPETSDAGKHPPVVSGAPLPPPVKTAPEAKSLAGAKPAPQTSDAGKHPPVEPVVPPPVKTAPTAKSPAEVKPAPQTSDAGKHPSAEPVVPPPVKTAPEVKSPAEVKPAPETSDMGADTPVEPVVPPSEPDNTETPVLSRTDLPFRGKERRKTNTGISDYTDRREHRVHPEMFKNDSVNRRRLRERRSERRSADATNTLSIMDLHKNFGRKEVVRGVGFSMKSGTIAGLLGPNGAGKTTIFYMIVGFYKPSKGDIKLNNVSIVRGPMYRRARMGIAYLPQEASIFRKLTVEENIWAILESRNDITKKEKKEKLNQLIEEFSIGRIRKQLGYTLSGGERRRTEIARSLAIEPKFLLLDEPFAGIDPIAVYEIKQIIKRLANEDIGILITDHNVRDTLEITTDAFIINHGIIVARGAKEHILSNQTVRDVYLGSEFRM